MPQRTIACTLSGRGISQCVDMRHNLSNTQFAVVAIIVSQEMTLNITLNISSVLCSKSVFDVHLVRC